MTFNVSCNVLDNWSTSFLNARMSGGAIFAIGTLSTADFTAEHISYNFSVIKSISRAALPKPSTLSNISDIGQSDCEQREVPDD